MSLVEQTMTVNNRSSSVSEDESTALNAILVVNRSDANDSEVSANNWSANCSSSAAVNDEVIANPDDTLEPIERFEKYANSEIIFHRQVVARSILETLKDVEQTEVQRVMDVISKLASDTEPSIKAELVEQIPQIGSYFANCNHCLPDVVPQYLLPILEQFLTDNNSQVRKMTQNAFVVMLEQQLIKTGFVEHQICPLLIQLTDFSNLDDYRVEAVIMMGKVVRFLGKEMTEKLLLQTLVRLCMDVSFHVRRVCASHFGNFCAVLGHEVTENVLLPQFRSLCQDSIWGVRKSCADVFVSVSTIVSHEVRRQILSPLFVNLLCDQSRWVKTAAFQALGPFISTFADPNKTGLYFSENGIVVIEDHTSNDSGFSAGSESAVDSPTDLDVDDDEDNALHEMLDNVSLEVNQKKQNGVESHNEVKDCNSVDFSQFMYWRVPIPELNLNDELNNKHISNASQFSYASPIEAKLPVYEAIHKSEAKRTQIESETFRAMTVNMDRKSEFESSCINLNETPPSFDDRFLKRQVLDDMKSDNTFKRMNSIENNAFYSTDNINMYKRSSSSQDIIPDVLLDHYLSMTNPIHYQTIDPDLSHHCAYSLPAVTLTLGRQNWPCLRETYELLASEMQWKVRWTLASSLHQMSLILGSDLTTRDLLPVFLSFMKDLDEVRFGILQNLASFLKLLLRPQQQGILPKISDFLKMDNNRNWRFRYTLAEQLIELTHIYSASEIKDYLLPIALVLLVDKVSEVRFAAIRVISVLIKCIYGANDEVDGNLEIIDNLNAHFAKSFKWIHRKTYIFLCQQLIEDNSLPFCVFTDRMLDHLLNMTTDNVPNIRLVLARTITKTLWPIAQFRSHVGVQQTLNELQTDKDEDVRSLAQLTSFDGECTELVCN